MWNNWKDICINDISIYQSADILRLLDYEGKDESRENSLKAIEIRHKTMAIRIRIVSE